MSTPGESRWKQMVAQLARRVGLSPHEVEAVTEGRIKAQEVVDTPAGAASAPAEERPAQEPAAQGEAELSAGTQQETQGGTPVVTADRAQEANEYMKSKMLFTPRMFQVINTVAPAAGERFADYYETIFGDGA